jgi:hypothetical protein
LPEVKVPVQKHALEQERDWAVNTPRTPSPRAARRADGRPTAPAATTSAQPKPAQYRSARPNSRSVYRHLARLTSSRRSRSSGARRYPPGQLPTRGRSFPPCDPHRRGRARRATHARPRLPASIFRIHADGGIIGHSGDPHSRPWRDHRAEGARGPVLAAIADQPGVIIDLFNHGRRAGHPALPDNRLVIRTEQRAAGGQACRHDHRERPGLQP